MQITHSATAYLTPDEAFTAQGRSTYGGKPGSYLVDRVQVTVGGGAARFRGTGRKLKQDGTPAMGVTEVELDIEALPANVRQALLP